jgi:hypothetical protein
MAYWHGLNRWSWYIRSARNYTSRRFVQEWKNRDPDGCREGRASGYSDELSDFTDSALLSKGMDVETVTRLLGSAIQKTRMGEKEIWRYSAYSLIFEFGSLVGFR